MESKNEILSYIDTLSLLVLGVFSLIFPLLFTGQLTDPFGLPKQALLAGIVLVSVILFGIRMIVASKVQLRTTPFDLPVILFTIFVFVSSVLSLNRFDSLTNFVPLLYAGLLFFVITNTVKKENTILFIIATLVIGGCLAALLSVFSYLQIYVLPYPDTHARFFTTFGSLLDQAMYLALVLPLAGYIAYPIVSPYIGARTMKWLPQEKSTATRAIAFAVAFLVILAGLGFTIFLLMTQQKPVILPFGIGFQTAFAAISQDTSRFLQSILLGSGYGEYLSVFTRFKLPSYNIDPVSAPLWSFTFFRSSTYFFELLATTGILGAGTFIFLIYRVIKERSWFVSLFLAIIAAFLLPFSFTIQTLFFILLGLFAAMRAIENPKRYADLEYYFVAMKKGLLVPAPDGQVGERKLEQTESRILPSIIFFFLLGIFGFLGYFTFQYVYSDMLFQKSFVAAQQNNGQQVYNLEADAIKHFPYRDTYYRIISQTNLILANSLAVSQAQSKTPNPQVQQTILQLIQQSINAGRTAVTLSPLTALNWDQLSGVYRALIGFGQNADQFALSTNQQATLLDPKNPQQYINYGGIFYQLGQWDNAQRQFQIAIDLKPDYANAYYNLGHALESKGDLTNALTYYQTVKQLVANDSTSLKKINDEITVLNQKIGQQTKASKEAANVQASEQKQPIDVNKPQAQLPERKPPAEIQGPPSVTVPPSKATPAP